MSLKQPYKYLYECNLGDVVVSCEDTVLTVRNFFNGMVYLEDGDGQEYEAHLAHVVRPATGEDCRVEGW